jgi:hypothetical protein
MVFSGAEAVFVSNTIEGGGVAGIRVAGDLRAEKNRIFGTGVRKAGPPNNAVWALEGARVELIENEIRTWRHALMAGKAAVTAVGNVYSDLGGDAFVIRDSPEEPVLSGNRARDVSKLK